MDYYKSRVSPSMTIRSSTQPRCLIVKYSNLKRTLKFKSSRSHGKWKRNLKGPVYTFSDQHGHDFKLDSLKTSVALKFMIIFKNLAATDHRKNGWSKYDHKLFELDVVTICGSGACYHHLAQVNLGCFPVIRFLHVRASK